MAQKHQPEQPDPQQPFVRLFFAVQLAQEVRANLHALSLKLQKASQFTKARISWVPPENFHITLFFLGNLPEDKALQLKDLLPETVAGMQEFALDLRHLGTFPKGGRKPPKVLWVGSFNTPPELQQLRMNCASILARAGLPIPEQDFSPHVTLARFRSTSGLTPFRNILKEYEFFKAGTFTVDRLVLMQSITGGGPARYIPYSVAEFPKAE